MGIIREMQRAHAQQVRAQQRAQAAAYRQHQQMRREAERAMKAAERSSAADDRERKRLYVEARAAEVAADKADLQSRLSELDTLLSTTLAVDDHIDFGRLKKSVSHPPFNPGNLAAPLPPPDWRRFEPAAPTDLGKVFGGQAKYQQQVAAAQYAFEQARAQHAAAEADRQRRLADQHDAYQQHCRKVEAHVAAHNAEVDLFAAAFAGADPNAVVEYFGMVLGNSVYPDDFPQHYRLAYVPESRQLVVEYHLPTLDVIPTVRDYTTSSPAMRSPRRPGRRRRSRSDTPASSPRPLCAPCTSYSRPIDPGWWRRLSSTALSKPPGRWTRSDVPASWRGAGMADVGGDRDGGSADVGKAGGSPKRPGVNCALTKQPGTARGRSARSAGSSSQATSTP